MGETMGRIAIYLREDSQLRDEAEQLALCKEYCRVHYGGDGEPVLYQDSFSPGNHPGLEALLADAREGKLRAVVSAELDRVAYSTTELAALLDELGTLSVSFAAVRDKLSTEGPLGRVFSYCVGNLAALDRQGAARRVRDSMMELARTGRWLGGVAPTGYKSKRVVKSGETEFLLTPVPGEAAVVRRIFDAFLETGSLTKTENDLNGSKIRTKNNRPYSRFSIRQILENPVYALADQAVYRYFKESGAQLCSPQERFDGMHGMMVYNKTAQQNGVGKSREISQWIVAVGSHEGFIPGADWIRAGELLDQNKSTAFRKPKSAHALLPGILRCGHCGSLMRPKQTQRMSEDGQPLFIYLCERKERSGSQDCQMRNVSGNLLDEAVCNQLLHLSPGSAAFLAQLEHNRMMSDPELDRMELERLQKRGQQITESISGLVFNLVKTIDKSAYSYIIGQIDSLHKENAVLEKRIAELSTFTDPHAMADEQIHAVKELLEVFQSGFEDMSVDQKRAILRALVEKVVWDGQRVQVYLYGADLGQIAVKG
jgi:site-specific DNA recombinase